MQAQEDGFQAGQTAKARRGPPCAVTPFRDILPASVAITMRLPHPPTSKEKTVVGGTPSI